MKRFILLIIVPLFLIACNKDIKSALNMPNAENIHKTVNIKGEWKYEIVIYSPSLIERMPVKLTMIYSFKDGEYTTAISCFGVVNGICRGTYTESDEKIKLNFPTDFFDFLEGKWSKIPKSLINYLWEYASYESLPIETASYFFKDKNTLVLTIEDSDKQFELKRCSGTYLNKIIN